MRIITLFDASGKIHALFRPSTDANAPALQFHPAQGHRVETLDVPAELQHLKLAQLHRLLQVDVSQSPPRFRAQSTGQKS